MSDDTKLKLYGVPVSQPVRAVMWACLAKGLPFDFEMTMPGARKGTRSEAFRKINPYGFTVPAIQDGDFTLGESHAILVYLANKHGWDDLYPCDPRSRARVDQYLHWHHRNTREITIRLFAPVMRPDLKIPADMVAQGAKVVHGVMSSIEGFLGATGAFLCGPAVTIADLACYTEVGQCTDDFCALWPLGEDKYPNICRWIAAMRQYAAHDEAHEGLAAFAPNIREAVRAANEAKAKAKL